MKRILLIEDEELLVKSLKKKLDLSGFEVYVAMDGVAGLEMALEHKPDLILLDIVLPLMDGITLLEKLREDDWGRKVPVIVLSNLNRADVVERGMKKGVKSYLVKTDLSPAEVVNKVKQELGLI